MEGEANNNIVDMVRKNWAAVPSLRNSLERKTSSRVDYGVERRSAHGAKVPSLAVEKLQTEHEGDKWKVSGDTISKARDSSEVAGFEKG